MALKKIHKQSHRQWQLNSYVYLVTFSRFVWVKCFYGSDDGGAFNSNLPILLNLPAWPSQLESINTKPSVLTPVRNANKDIFFLSINNLFYANENSLTQCNVIRFSTQCYRCSVVAKKLHGILLISNNKVI